MRTAVTEPEGQSLDTAAPVLGECTHEDPPMQARLLSGGIQHDGSSQSFHAPPRPVLAADSPKFGETLKRVGRVGPGAAAIFLYFMACVVFIWLPGAFKLRKVPLPGNWVPVNSTHSLWIKDFSVDNPHLPEKVPNTVLAVYCITLPVVASGASLLTGFGVLDFTNFWKGFGLAFITHNVGVEVTKKWVGRPRPCFYAKCDAAGIIEKGSPFELPPPDCRPPGVPDDFRKSYPSGHSSNSFMAAMYVSLYLGPKVRGYWNPPGSRSGPRLPSTFSAGAWGSVDLSTLYVLLVSWPLFGASAFISVSRVHDYMHHVGDVATGAIVGAGSAYWFYRHYFPAGQEGKYLPLRDTTPSTESAV